MGWGPRGEDLLSVTSAATGAQDDGLDEASNSVIVLIDERRLDEAEQAAHDLLKNYPGVHDGLERLTMVYARLGDLARAAEYSTMTTFITDELFSDFIECKYRAYLKLSGPTGQTSFEGPRRQLLLDYHAKAREYLLRTHRDKAVPTDVRLSDVLAQRYDLAVDVTATDADISVHFDALIAEPADARANPLRYTPIVFAPEEKIRHQDKLRLALCASVLSRHQAFEPVFGRILHGSGFTSSKIQLGRVLAGIGGPLQEMHALKRDSDPPPLHLNAHCPTCQFRNRCRAIAVEKDDLSLLRGIKPKEILKLKHRGIFTVTQLSLRNRSMKR